MAVKELTGARARPAPAGWADTVRAAAYPIAGALLGAALLVGATIGPANVAPLDVLKSVLNHVFGLDLAVTARVDAIVWDIRVPRVLLAALVGGTLGYGGAAYQGVFRNPLADPYLLGVAAGAGLAATLAIVGPVPVRYGNFSVITLVAFGGALAAVAITYALARVEGSTPTTTLILSGVAVSAFAVSATSYFMLANQRDMSTILSWLLGGFNSATWSKMWFILPYTLPAALVIFLHGRVLNVLQLDQQQAEQLGVNVERTRLLVLVAASLAAAAAVSVAGIIGFVGLVAPHAVRLIVGPDYRRLLPLSALVGAALLVLADTGARTAVSPGELPVGVITSSLGAPFFLYLLRKQRKAFF